MKPGIDAGIRTNPIPAFVLGLVQLAWAADYEAARSDTTRIQLDHCCTERKPGRAPLVFDAPVGHRHCTTVLSHTVTEGSVVWVRLKNSGCNKDAAPGWEGGLT